MGDPRGPTSGWSHVLPTKRGWYEIASARVIDQKQPNVTRIWTDGSGGFWSPTMLSIEDANQIGVKSKEIVRVTDNGQLVVFLPVYGSFTNTYFRALGPLLDKHLPKTPTVDILRPYQNPNNYLTSRQRREADEIERSRDSESS